MFESFLYFFYWINVSWHLRSSLQKWFGLEIKLGGIWQKYQLWCFCHLTHFTLYIYFSIYWRCIERVQYKSRNLEGIRANYCGLLRIEIVIFSNIVKIESLDIYIFKWTRDKSHYESKIIALIWLKKRKIWRFEI